MSEMEKMDPKAKRSESEQFATDHLAECAAELVEWQDKAVLRDGKVRELAAKCAEWAGEHDSLKIAERMVERTALKACAMAGGEV